MMQKKRYGWLMVTVVILLMVMTAPVMAQDGAETEILLLGVEWQFWAALLIILAGMFAVTVLINLYLAELRDRVPLWVKVYAPAGYEHATTGFETGIEYLRTRAKRTPTPLDDELVEVVDKNGRKLIIKTAAILGHKVDEDDTTKELPTAETDAGFSG